MSRSTNRVAGGLRPERLSAATEKLASLSEIPALIGASAANLDVAGRESTRLAAQHAGLAHELALGATRALHESTHRWDPAVTPISGQRVKGIP